MSLGERFQQELLTIAVGADAELLNKTPRKRSFLSVLTEFFFTGLGLIVGTALHLAPSRLANRASKAMAASKAKTAPADPKPMEPKSPDEAVLIITSHPQPVPREAHLLGEMILLALKISNQLAPGARFRLVQAVDDFALDTLSPSVKGLYQGIMSRAHIAMDRIPGGKPAWIGPLLGRVRYFRIFFEILRALKRGEIVCLALPGGVIHNSRILYSMREFAQRAYREMPQRLKAACHRRDFELSVVRLLCKGAGSACLTGNLSPQEELALQAYLDSRGIPKGTLSELTADFREELRMLSPFRLRLFRILLGRICGRGMALRVIPISHVHPKGGPGLFCGEPWKVRQVLPGWEQDLKGFIRRSFPAV
ncbi:MAG: hypothetical protein A2901_04425 [Elusimicrobia bacterium RIFCSPLOWO2_01_FULL_54_10]|nr:MAG: hypothetical protein A2901_04425 [Elusimicrobia bacterium RIFCSPLOWO2_01_FULL_54_10]